MCACVCVHTYIHIIACSQLKYSCVSLDGMQGDFSCISFYDKICYASATFPIVKPDLRMKSVLSGKSHDTAAY